MRIDAHMHVAGNLASVGWRGKWTDDRVVIEAADRLEIDQLCCSIPIQGLDNPRPDGMREVNDSVIYAMRRFPGRILGYAFLDPRFQHEARDEIDRCVLKHGMMGVKLYNQCRCWDPMVLPIVERCIELRVPILHHGGKQTPASGRPWQTYRSDSGDFARLARLYPEVTIIEGHPIVGDWEWAIKTLRDVPNVYVDTSGIPERRRIHRDGRAPVGGGPRAVCDGCVDGGRRGQGAGRGDHGAPAQGNLRRKYETNYAATSVTTEHEALDGKSFLFIFLLLCPVNNRTISSFGREYIVTKC